MTTHSVSFAMSPELSEVARRNCNESPENNEANIAALIEWVGKAPHLKARTNDRLLLAFLRRSRFSLENAKRYIDAYYSFKNLFPEVLRERLVNDSLLELSRTGIHIVAQQPISATGPRLIISRFSRCDPKKYLPRQIFKLFFMFLEILAMEDNNATVCGISYVVDVRDVTMEQMLQYDPFFLKKMWMLVQHGLPVKFNEIHVINMRRDGQAIFKFVTNFLPTKMPFKFMVHQKAEELYRHLPRDAMTIEYSGHNGFASEATKTWTHKLRDYRSYFADDDIYGTNEKLRVGLTSRWRNAKENLASGISGSFRKIEID